MTEYSLSEKVVAALRDKGLTVFTAEQLQDIKQISFNTQGAGADATGKSIYFDYIQFVK